MTIGRSGAAGEVLAADPGLVVETGPGGVGRRWNIYCINRFWRRTAAMYCILYLAVYFRLVAVWLGTAKCGGGVCVG